MGYLNHDYITRHQRMGANDSKTSLIKVKRYYLRMLLWQSFKTIKGDMESEDDYQRIASDGIDDEYIDNVALEMECILAANPITKERLRKIPRTNTYANSLNVFVGRQRSGKSYQAIQEIIKISRIDPNAHLVIYINENGTCDDDTFKRFKELIDLPIAYVKYSEAEKFLKKLIEYKEIYNNIKTEHAENEIPKECLPELLENLYIDDLDKEHLHTLILMEDATTQKTVKDSTNYINHLMTKCAHIQCSFFVIIHYWKALTPNLKSNIYTAYIYPGYSRQQLTYILYQMNLPDNYKDIYNIYRKLNGHQKLIIDCNEFNFKVSD